MTNSTVLNKLQSYSRISALGPECHCTSRFKRVMCISCRPHVDVHKVERGSGACGQGEGGQKSDFLKGIISLVHGLWFAKRINCGQVIFYYNILCICDTIHEKVPSLSSQFCQKPACKEVGVNFSQKICILPSE